jgi:ABC-2 type transport system ATP-binding protein
VQAVCDRVGIIRHGRLAATENVDDLIHGQFHRLTMRFDHMPPDGLFDRDGTREISRHEQLVTVEVREDLNHFLSQAVEYGVLEIETHQVSLEEVFLEYYGEDQNGHGSQDAWRDRHLTGNGGNGDA